MQQLGKQNSEEENGERLVKGSDCSSCHAADRQVVGPAYSAVAKRYKGQTDAVEKLATRIRGGGSGNWGDVDMTPHPDLTDAQRREMVKWILSQKDPVAAQLPDEAKLYAYTLKDGTTVKLDFPLMVEGKGQKVTKDVFRGYQLYNSYCYRCHGQDAMGGQLAPDLRRSLVVGMKQQEFLSVAMAGRKEKGMPGWAGFLSEDEVVRVYKYVKGRSLDLVPSGRPPSEQD
jgi:cytochrome c